MKSRFVLALSVFIFFLQISIPAVALQCANQPIDLIVKARAKQSMESSVLDCMLEGEVAVHLGGKLISSLDRARGYIEVRFFNQQGKQLWVSRRGPWLGAFSGLAFDESFAVPSDTTRIHIVAKSESSRENGAGEWRIIGLVVSPGVIVVRKETAEGTVITTAQAARERDNMFIKIYPVGDILMLEGGMMGGGMMGGGGGWGNQGGMNRGGGW